MEGTGIRSIRREYGEDMLRATVLYLLVRVDELCDGRSTGAQLAAMASTLVDDFPNVSIETMAIALRRGVGREKIYGKLTYGHLTSWLTAHLEEVKGDNENQHLSTHGRR